MIGHYDARLLIVADVWKLFQGTRSLWQGVAYWSVACYRCCHGVGFTTAISDATCWFSLYKVQKSLESRLSTKITASPKIQMP